MDSYALLALIALIIGVLLLSILIPLRVRESKDEDSYSQKALVNVVEGIVQEIKTVLAAYPDLERTTVIRGESRGRPLELGSIYGPNGNITFSIRLPERVPEPFLPPFFNPRVKIEGAIGDYSITATANSRNQEYYKVSYTSQADTVVAEILEQSGKPKKS